MNLNFLSLVQIAVVIVFAPMAAVSQVAFDVTVEDLKERTNRISLGDLSVNDTAYISPDFCTIDGVLHLPSVTRPTNFANWTTSATGITFQATMLPGKRVSLKLMDAAQAQKLARGDVSETQTMTREAMLLEASEQFERFFAAGTLFWKVGSNVCADAREHAAS